VVLANVRKKLKEGGWLGSKKENTLEKFITSLAVYSWGSFP